MKKSQKCRYMGGMELIEPRRGNLFKVKFHSPDGGVLNGTIRLPFKTPSDYTFFARVFMETKWK